MTDKQNIILYSTGCPRCRVLKIKLEEAGIPYTEETDTYAMLDLGILTAPMLRAEGRLMNFNEAIDYVRRQRKEQSG